MVDRLRQSVRVNVQALRQPGSFVQNLAVTFSGAAPVAEIGFLLTPIMSRIYPPASYGQFAVYNSVVGNLNMLTSLGYPGAMLLPRHRKEFLALVNFILLVTLTDVFLLTIVLLFAAEPLRKLLHLEGIGGWIYTIPLLLLFDFNAVMFTWYTREKSFSKRAGVLVVTTLGGRGFTIGYGLWSSGEVAGLVLGEFFNRLTAFASLPYGGLWRQIIDLQHNFSWNEMKAAARRYCNFPLYFLPANYVGALSAQISIFDLATGFGFTVIGLYSFSVSLLELPVTLIENAIAPLFLKKATEVHAEEPERLSKITLQLYCKLLYLGAIAFGIITVYGDCVFRIVFGTRWEMSELSTSFLGCYYFFKLISHATGGIHAILNKQRFLLILSAVLLFVRGLSLGIGLLGKNLNLALLLFSLGSLLVGFLTDLHILYLLKLLILKIGYRTFFIVSSTLFLLVLLRFLLQYLFEWSAPNFTLT